MQKNVTLIFLMIWATILTIWAVNTVTAALNNARSITVNGIPGQPEPRQFSTVQIDKDTVWVIDSNSALLKIITHDEDGYHLTQTQMSIQNK